MQWDWLANQNGWPSSYAFWAFLLLGVLSHARGAVLLMREARNWLNCYFERRARLRRR